jgi:hypothetical protein
MVSQYIALPKGVSEKNFDAAIRDFRKVLATLLLTNAEQPLHQDHDAGSRCGPYSVRRAPGYDG